MKRLVCIVFVMVTLLSLTACGENRDETILWQSNPHTDQQQETELAVGDIVILGTYEQDNDLANGTEPIEWIVLKQEQGRAMLVSRYVLDCQRFNNECETIGWQFCTLRYWLNGSFYEAAFTTDEQRVIAGNPEFSDDNVFLLNLNEAQSLMSSVKERQCGATAYAIANGVYVRDEYAWWWLRESGTELESAMIVMDDGRIWQEGVSVDGREGVRPAVWVDTEEMSRLGEEQPEPTVSQYNTGDILSLGKYEQDGDTSNGAEDIEWIVLEAGQDRMLVISKYAILYEPYHTKGMGVRWAECSLRTMLNTEFLNTAFNTEESSRITINNTYTEDNPEYNTKGGNIAFGDSVFCLSIDEAKKYFATAEERGCYPTVYVASQSEYLDEDEECTWWLRSPGRSSYLAAEVYKVGEITCEGDNVEHYHAVRPAMWISL